MSPSNIIILVYFSVFLLLVWLFPKLIKVEARRLVPFIIAALLTYLTLFVINQTPIFLDEEINALKLLDGVLDRTVNPDSVLAKEQIVLVDVSAHAQLLSNPQPLFSDSSANTIITDRQKLACFLGWLTNDSVSRHVDAIVNDILLEEISTNDSSIKESLYRLTNSKKLFQAKSLTEHNNLKKNSFDLTNIATYSVDIIEHDGIYFSHALLDISGRPSLPYALYLNRQQIDPPFKTHSRLFQQRLTQLTDTEAWVCNWFIPDLILTDEDIMGKPLDEHSSLFDHMLSQMANFFFGPTMSTSAMGISRFLPVGLGAACQHEGQTELMNQCRQAKENGQRVTLLIGSFSGSNDTHQTTYGTMHGGLILLNVYLNLLAQRHLLTSKYVLFLLIGYWAVARLLIVLRLPSNNDFENIIIKRAFKRLKIIMKWSQLRNKPVRVPLYYGYFIVREIIFYQIHYWLLFVLLIGSAICFGRIVNVMGLTIFLAALDFGLRGLKESNES